MVRRPEPVRTGSTGTSASRPATCCPLHRFWLCTCPPPHPPLPLAPPLHMHIANARCSSPGRGECPLTDSTRLGAGINQLSWHIPRTGSVRTRAQSPRSRLVDLKKGRGLKKNPALKSRTNRARRRGYGTFIMANVILTLGRFELVSFFRFPSENRHFFVGVCERTSLEY